MYPSFLHQIKNRYTTKTYLSSPKIDSSQIRELQEVLQYSPSSINSQPWFFHFISEEKLKSRFADVSFHNCDKVNQSSHLVLFCTPTQSIIWEEQHLCHLPIGAQNYYQKHLQNSTEEEKQNWMIRQLYLSLGVFLSACACMEIDSTPMEGIDTQAYNEILNDPLYSVVFAVCLGFRHPEDLNQPQYSAKKRKPITEISRII